MSDSFHSNLQYGLDKNKASQHEHSGAHQGRHTHAEALHAKLDRLQGIADPLHGRTDPKQSMKQAGGALPVKDDRSHNSKVGPLESEHKGALRRE